MAENKLDGEVIGVALDGTGYGTDGCIWGGEFMVAGYKDFHRAAHLSYVPIPGGEAAIRRPGRMALSYLLQAFGESLEPGSIPGLSPEEEYAVRLQVQRGLNAPLTSSAGRLFDAVSALLGVCAQVTYEGQAAIELEGISAGPTEHFYNYEIIDGSSGDMEIDMLPAIRDIVGDIRSGEEVGVISSRFHSTVAEAATDVCSRIAADTGLSRVVLSGGVFQNMLLLGMLIERLRSRGLEVFRHSLVPTNDGGVSLGQAVIAARRVMG
jgi:hydrogenase maturation protein HypF